MEFLIINNLPTLRLDVLMTLAVGAVAYTLGGFIKAHSAFLKKMSIPVPFLGGFPVAVLCCILKVCGLLSIEFQPDVPRFALNLFLCCLALFGSWRLLKNSLAFVTIFWLLATVLGLLQSGVGILMAKVLGMDLHLGVLIGSVSLMGGGLETYHQFANAFSALGDQAAELAAGAGTFGIVVAMSLGAPFGEWLIHRYKLTVPEYPESTNQVLEGFLKSNKRPFYQHLSREVIRVFAFVMVSALLGEYLSRLLAPVLMLPAYLGGMIVAVLLRNINDALQLSIVEGVALRTMTKVALCMFIVTNACALPLVNLFGLEWKAFAILLVQLLLNLVFAVTAYFTLLGKNYESMLIAVGGIGFSTGITANGLSNMQSLCEKYGPCMRMIFIVALVGMMLVGLTNTLTVQWLLTLL